MEREYDYFVSLDYDDFGSGFVGPFKLIQDQLSDSLAWLGLI